MPVYRNRASTGFDSCASSNRDATVRDALSGEIVSSGTDTVNVTLCRGDIALWELI
jgi:hypothetical protein